jgi:hypothetical protein
MAALTRGDEDKALKLFINATREEPKFAEAYNKVAAIRALRSDHVECVKLSTLALQRQPRHYGALAAQGLALAALAGGHGTACVLSGRS